MRYSVPGEELLRHVAFGLALASEGIAVIIIGAAVATGAWRALRSALRERSKHPWGDVRLDLGRWLALALEFLLAADVVRTAVAPNWEDIGKLAAIAVIRTGLNFFLHQDIQEVQENREKDGAPGEAGAIPS
jgi:uncharacterized membrane protein